MPIRVQTPDGAIIEFPESMSADDIGAAMQQIHPSSSSAAPQSSGNLREQYKEAIRRGDENYPGTKIPVPGTLDLLQRRMSDPFGVQDELVGAGAYLGARVHNLFDYRGDDQRDPDLAYMQAAERIRAEKEMARERLGWGGALAADVVGGLGTTGPGGIVGPLANKAAPFAERAWQAAKAGAGFGAAAGAGNAEGDIGNRLIGAGEGAATGAVLGPAISEIGVPVVSALGRSGYNALANPSAIPGNVGNALYGAGAATSNALRRVIPGASANIDDTLLRALQRQGMTPADAAAQMTADMRASIINGVPVNPPVALADSGPAMRELAYTVKAQPGEAKTLAERVLEGRQRGENGFDSQYQRMKEGTQSALQAYGENAAALEDSLNASRSAASNAAYDKFRDSGVEIPVEDILQAHAAEMAPKVAPNDDLVPVLNRAYGKFINEKYKPAGLDGPSLVEDAQHNLKIMGLDKKIAAAEQEAAGGGATQRADDVPTIPKKFTENVPKGDEYLKANPNGKGDATGPWFIEGDKPVYMSADRNVLDALFGKEYAKKFDEYPSITDNSTGQPYTVWFKPGERARAQQTIDILTGKAGEKFTPEYHKQLGDALGYPIQAVDRYVAGTSKESESTQSAYVDELKRLREGLITEHQARSRFTEPLTPDQFQSAKEQLDDMIGEAKRGGQKYQAGVLKNLKDRLLQRADELTAVTDAAGNPVLDANGNPVSLYKNARHAFQAPTKTLEALEAGKGITKTDIDRVATDFAKLTPEQQRAYRIGAASDLTERMGNKNTGNNITLQLDTPNIQTRIGAVAGQQNLDQLNALRSLETRMFQTRNRVIGGSKTAENQQNLNEATLDAATSAAQKFMQGRPLAAAAQAVGKAIQYATRFREEDAAALARDLFATDPAARRATIARLEKAYGAPKVQQAVNAATQMAMRSAATSTVAPVVGNFLAPSPRYGSTNALYRSGR